MANQLFDRPEFEEDREPLDTKSMLLDGVWEGLKKSQGNISIKANEIDGEIDGENAKPTDQSFVNIPTEKVLTDVYAVRDGLIQCFSNVEASSRMANDLTDHINRLGTCIHKLGGDSEAFNPLDHVSGLQAPDLSENADKVVGMTKQCYSLGDVGTFNISKDGKTIELSFSGLSAGINYKANGIVTAQNGWTGNEAIDYVFTTGSGKMSVKAFESGRWIDKCADTSSGYDVRWELEEWPEGMERIENEVEDVSDLNEDVSDINEDVSGTPNILQSKNVDYKDLLNKDDDLSEDKETGEEFTIIEK